MDVASFFRHNERPLDELQHDDKVYGALTQAVRELALAQLRTRVPLDEVESVTTEIKRLTERLLVDAKDGPFGIELDGGGNARNHGNTVVGLRNPTAMALGPHTIVWDDKGASASLHLGPLFEGPPGCVHGGVLALVLDQLFGEAAASGGVGGMTGRLTLAYRRPTPLGDVSMAAWVHSGDGIKTIVKGELKDAAGNVTVEAEGLFILPRWVRDNAGGWPRRRRTFE